MHFQAPAERTRKTVLLYQGKTIDYWKQEKKAEIRAARRHEQEERNERIQAEKRRQLEIERRKGLQAAAKTAEERRRREEAQKRREAEHEKMRDMDAIFRKNLAEGFVQQEYIVRDAHKRRWARCELCDDIKMETEFAMIGGPGKVNLGICRDCMRRR